METRFVKRKGAGDGETWRLPEAEGELPDDAVATLALAVVRAEPSEAEDEPAWPLCVVEDDLSWPDRPSSPSWPAGRCRSRRWRRNESSVRNDRKAPSVGLVTKAFDGQSGGEDGRQIGLVRGTRLGDWERRTEQANEDEQARPKDEVSDAVAELAAERALAETEQEADVVRALTEDEPRQKAGHEP
jgi:hypothetical protein